MPEHCMNTTHLLVYVVRVNTGSTQLDSVQHIIYFSTQKCVLVLARRSTP